MGSRNPGTTRQRIRQSRHRVFVDPRKSRQPPCVRRQREPAQLPTLARLYPVGTRRAVVAVCRRSDQHQPHRPGTRQDLVERGGNDSRRNPRTTRRCDGDPHRAIVADTTAQCDGRLLCRRRGGHWHDHPQTRTEERSRPSRPLV